MNSPGEMLGLDPATEAWLSGTATTTHRLPMAVCPSCGALLDGHHAPSPGDLTVCMKCSALLAFSDQGLRLLEDEELAQFPAETLDALNEVRALLIACLREPSTVDAVVFKEDAPLPEELLALRGALIGGLVQQCLASSNVVITAGCIERVIEISRSKWNALHAFYAAYVVGITAHRNMKPNASTTLYGPTPDLDAVYAGNMSFPLTPRLSNAIQPAFTFDEEMILGFILLFAAFLLPACASSGHETRVAGMRVPAELVTPQRAGGPPSTLNQTPPPNDPIWGAFGCADVQNYADIPMLPSSSQQLFSDMVSGICGQINFLTGDWFGAKCTALCTGPGDWCTELKVGVIVDSSVTCNTCATTYPPAAPMDKILACAADPNNTAP